MTGISGGARTRTGGPQAPAPRLVRTGTSPTAPRPSTTGCWSRTAYRKGHSWPPWVWPESWRSTPLPAADGGLGLVRGEQREGVGRDAGEGSVDDGGVGSAPGLVVDAAIRMLADPSVSVTFSLRRTSMPRVSPWSIQASASCEMNSWLPRTAKTPSGASRSPSGASASATWLTVPSMRSPPSTTTSGCCPLTWSTTRRVKPASRIGPTCRSVTRATRRPSSPPGAARVDETALDGEGGQGRGPAERPHDGGGASGRRGPAGCDGEAAAEEEREQREDRRDDGDEEGRRVGRRGSGGGAEADGVALARLLALDLAVLRRRARRQVLEQVRRRVGDRLDGLVEGVLVGLARLRAATDLAHVLERRGVHLLRRGGRLEVVELSDVAAHASTVCRGTHAGPLQTASFEVMALPTSVSASPRSAGGPVNSSRPGGCQTES